jgi:hypothetical protein
VKVQKILWIALLELLLWPELVAMATLSLTAVGRTWWKTGLIGTGILVSRIIRCFR